MQRGLPAHGRRARPPPLPARPGCVQGRVRELTRRPRPAAGCRELAAISIEREPTDEDYRYLARRAGFVVRFESPLELPQPSLCVHQPPPAPPGGRAVPGAPYKGRAGGRLATALLRCFGPWLLHRRWAPRACAPQAPPWGSWPRSSSGSQSEWGPRLAWCRLAVTQQASMSGHGAEPMGARRCASPPPLGGWVGGVPTAFPMVPPLLPPGISSC